MTDDTPSILERVSTALDDPTAAETILVAHLATVDGGRTRAALVDTLAIAEPTHALTALVDRGVLTRRLREADNGGRNPYAYELTADTRAEVAVETPDWSGDDLRRRVVRELATMHYCRTLSSATSKRIAREIPGASPSQVATALTLLHDDGIVETVSRTSGRAQWRLVGAGLFAPYRALTEGHE